VEAQNCPKREKPDGESRPGQKPEKKELTEEEKAAGEAARECRKKAFEACGIQMPERPEGKPEGTPPDEKKEHPDAE
jgi:hypothetical protein